VKCPEIAPLVSRFFDGELDGGHMRTVALHITRCAECEDELRALERIQGLVAGFVAEEVAAMDVDSIWMAVSSRIDEPTSARSWSQRARAWGDGFELVSPATVWPALAAAAAVFLTFNLWPDGTPTVGVDVARKAPIEIAERVAQVGRAERLLQEAMDQIDNSAVFESIVGGVDSLMIEPKTQTAVLWINDTGEFR
jgi:anti-sigma factor RsiW